MKHVHAEMHGLPKSVRFGELMGAVPELRFFGKGIERIWLLHAEMHGLPDDL